MKLSFGQLTLSYFCTVQKAQTIDLACGIGLHYVKGVNELEPDLGANDVGKSTLWRGLTRCLYGKTADNLKSTDIRTWKSDKTSKVSLEFWVDDSPQLLVRTAGPNKLILNDKTTSQEEIVKLIGIDFDVFVNTILLAQGRDLFLDLDPKDKMKMFSDVLGLDRWDARSWFASTTVKELNQYHAVACGELTGLESSHKQLKELEAKARQDAAAWEATRQEVLTKADKEIEALETDIGKVQRIVDEASLSSDGAGTEAKALSNELDKIEAEFRKGDSERARIVARCEILTRQGEKIQKQITELKKAKVCPTCGQKLKVADLDKHRAELQQEGKKVITEFDDLDDKDNMIKSSLIQIEERINKTRENFQQFRDREERANDVLVVTKPKLIGYQNKADLLKRQREQYRSDDNPHQTQARDLKRRRTKVEVEINDLKEDLTKLAERIERTKFWVKGFKDIQLFLVEDALQELELSNNSLLPELGLDTWSIKYDVEKELKSGETKPELHATILSPYNDREVKWKSWGGGVSQRLRIAGALALSEVLLNRAGVQCDLVVLDEPSRGLSSEGIENLIEMLSEYATRSDKAIFLVDHRLFEGGMFASTTIVTKTKQGSQITLGVAK